MAKDKSKYEKKGEEILRIAAEIFRKKGYQKATMRDIGDAAGMLSGSLYYYYPSKEDLLHQICTSSIEKLLEETEHINERDWTPDEKLKKVIHTHLMYIFNYIDYLSVFVLEMRFLPDEYMKEVSEKRDRYDRIIQSMIEKGNEERIFNIADSRLATLSILGMINWTTQWYKPTGRLPQDQIIDNMVGYIFNGILNKSE